MVFIFKQSEIPDVPEELPLKNTQENRDAYLKKYYEISYRWSLVKFKEEYEELPGCFIRQIPFSERAGCFNKDEFEKYLNEYAYFDFEYEFNEDDELYIAFKFDNFEIEEFTRPNIEDILSFRYKNNRWNYGSNFYAITEEVMRGYISIEELYLKFTEQPLPVVNNPFIDEPRKNSSKFREKYKSFIRNKRSSETVYVWSLSRKTTTDVAATGFNTYDFYNNTLSNNVGCISETEFIKNLNYIKGFSDKEYLPQDGDCITINFCYLNYPDVWDENSPSWQSLQTMQAVFENNEWTLCQKIIFKNKPIKSKILNIGKN